MFVFVCFLGTYWVLVERPTGRRLNGIPKRRCEDNIKMDLQELGWGGMDSIVLA